jgi:hypothetical protein
LQAEDQREHVFDNGGRCITGDIGDSDAALGGGANVDVIGAGGGNADQLEFGCLRQQSRATASTTAPAKSSRRENLRCKSTLRVHEEKIQLLGVAILLGISHQHACSIIRRKKSPTGVGLFHIG